jgi:hypothetical protein
MLLNVPGDGVHTKRQMPKHRKQNVDLQNVDKTTRRHDKTSTITKPRQTKRRKSCFGEKY